jgi:hypothetical protein
MVTFTCGFSPLVTRIFKNLFFFVDRGVVSSSFLASLKASRSSAASSSLIFPSLSISKTFLISSFIF